MLKPEKDILLQEKPDRRMLSKVPDQEGVRTTQDRRRVKAGGDQATPAVLIQYESLGRRYLVDYDVDVVYETDGVKRSCKGKAVDASTTGMLLEVELDATTQLNEGSKIKLKFMISPGSMPEGYEMKVNIGARFIRAIPAEAGKVRCGLEFTETLAQYANRTKNRYLLASASIWMFFITAFVLLLRAESVLYFDFNKALYAYSIVAATFLLTRYLFGALYRPVPINPDFTPGVTIIIPCFNEEEWIQRTIHSCLNQDYPLDKLEVMVIDDCSTDKSPEKIRELIDTLKEKETRYALDDRLISIRHDKNYGKREAMARGALLATHDLVVFVDSDSFLDPFAIRNLVQPFQDEEMGGVCGRTDVANTYTNSLTKMQAVRYYIAFRVMKAAESYFDTVTCLSGPLACYRKDLALKYLDPWLNQTFLGERATLGDDRSLTNFILRYHRTAYQDTALVSTIVPNTHSVFLRQQMRWKRSWLRESLIASRFFWKKEPFAALSFYMGVLVPFLAPLIVLYNLIYIPLIHRVFPLTFLIGITLMALMMSMAQLFLRRSSTWVYGIWFVIYYEAVLLWQMPVAWFSFWKSAWGTRLTAADVLAQSKKTGPKTEGA